MDRLFVKRFNVSQIVIFAVIGLLLTGCGGKHDPVARVIDEALEPEIDHFDVDPENIFPGDRVDIEWEADGLFDEARVYISEDSRISSSDVEVVDEDCGFSSSRHCGGADRRVFECRFGMDNSFDCEEDDDLLRRNDLSDFLDQIPKAAYIILEVCDDDNDCDTRSRRVTFN